MLATAADSRRPITEIRKDMKEQEQGKASYVAAIRLAYWQFIEKISNGKYVSLLNLKHSRDIIQLRCGGNSSKESTWWSFNTFLEAMNKV